MNSGDRVVCPRRLSVRGRNLSLAGTRAPHGMRSHLGAISRLAVSRPPVMAAGTISPDLITVILSILAAYTPILARKLQGGGGS